MAPDLIIVICLCDIITIRQDYCLCGVMTTKTTCVNGFASIVLALSIILRIALYHNNERPIYTSLLGNWFMESPTCACEFNRWMQHTG